MEGKNGLQYLASDTFEFQMAIGVKISYSVLLFVNPLSGGCSAISSEFYTFFWQIIKPPDLEKSFHSFVHLFIHSSSIIQWKTMSRKLFCERRHNGKQDTVLDFQKIKVTASASTNDTKVWILRSQWSPELLTNWFIHKRLKQVDGRKYSLSPFNSLWCIEDGMMTVMRRSKPITNTDNL